MSLIANILRNSTVLFPVSLEANLPDPNGLLNVSEMVPHQVKNVAEEVSEGQEIMVKCIAVDGNGKIKLSRQALLSE